MSKSQPISASICVYLVTETVHLPPSQPIVSLKPPMLEDHMLHIVTVGIKPTIYFLTFSTFYISIYPFKINILFDLVARIIYLRFVRNLKNISMLISEIKR